METNQEKKEVNVNPTSEEQAKKLDEKALNIMLRICILFFVPPIIMINIASLPTWAIFTISYICTTAWVSLLLNTIKKILDKN
jgi:uncharacterized protein (DUF983 family)